MRSKQANSEADALFMKANRKHQILLNFELKRIAVEQKMRERYFAFEKSLIITHQEKIISRQKSLGIYRPQTILDKKRPKDSFFITAVAMETKARMTLPPVVDSKGGARDGASRRRRQGTKNKSERDHPNSYNILIHETPKENEPLPVLKQNFAVVQARKHSVNSKTSTKNAAVSSSIERFESVEDESQSRDVKSGKLYDGSGENGIGNKQSVKDLKEPTNGANAENMGSISDSQTGENVDKTEVKLGNAVNKEKEERNEESKPNLLEDSAKENKEESDENIAENRDEKSGKNVKTFKQIDADKVRSKSVLSGAIDDNTSLKISAHLRAQSAGVQGRVMKRPVTFAH